MTIDKSDMDEEDKEIRRYELQKFLTEFRLFRLQFTEVRIYLEAKDFYMASARLENLGEDAQRLASELKDITKDYALWE